MRSPWQQVKTEGPKLREGGRGGAEGLTGSLGDYGMVGVMMAQSSEVGGGGAMTCSVWKMQNLDSPQRAARISPLAPPRELWPCAKLHELQMSDVEMCDFYWPTRSATKM